ncbi:MAG: substrate-binding domain-containing protein [Geobacteraceae bacterium]
MPNENIPLHNKIKLFREERSWSQQELADRTGISRAGISAIETGKLVPSTVAALSLARVFSSSVEELFQLGGDKNMHWAWQPQRGYCRFWRSMVGERMLIYPVETSPHVSVPHDGIFQDGRFIDNMALDPRRTLVLACCDPAVGFLAAEYARTTPYRMLPLSRSSRQALLLLRDGVVHAAGLHMAEISSPEVNRQAAKEILDVPFRLLRVAIWQAGLAMAPGLGLKTVDEALDANIRWIGREPGSGARQVQDQILQGVIAPTVMAKSHKEVVDAIRSGWADVGVSVRLVCEEAGLDFLTVREEAYDICLPLSQTNDPRIISLVDVVRSPSFQNMLGQLPGYDISTTGDMF